MQDAHTTDQEGTPPKDNKTQDFSHSPMTENKEQSGASGDRTQTEQTEINLDVLYEQRPKVMMDAISVADKLNAARKDGIANGTIAKNGDTIAGVGEDHAILNGFNGNRFSKADAGDTSLSDFSDESETNKAALRAGNIERRAAVKRVNVAGLLIGEALRICEAQRAGKKFEAGNVSYNAENGKVSLSYGEKSLTKKEQAARIAALERKNQILQAKVAQLELPIPE